MIRCTGLGETPRGFSAHCNELRQLSSSVHRHEVSGLHIWKTVWLRITQFYSNAQTDLADIRTGYDATICFRSFAKLIWYFTEWVHLAKIRIVRSRFEEARSPLMTHRMSAEIFHCSVARRFVWAHQLVGFLFFFVWGGGLFSYKQQVNHVIILFLHCTVMK